MNDFILGLLIAIAKERQSGNRPITLDMLEKMVQAARVHVFGSEWKVPEAILCKAAQDASSRVSRAIAY